MPLSQAKVCERAHFLFRHPRVGGDLSESGSGWVPAYAGMTEIIMPLAPTFRLT
jgi:hypothetical protein